MRLKRSLVLVFLFLVAVFSPLFPASDSITRVFNYPNPYDPDKGTTSICFFYNNQSGSAFTLTYYVCLYNLVGQRVYARSGSEALTVATGTSTVAFSWNGRTNKGGKVPPGVYYIRVITAGGGTNGQSLSRYGKMLVK